MAAELPWDVVIAGAGPTGLTLANHLGALGTRTLVLETLPDLIDYPRGVGMDDESLRSFQAVGLVEPVRRHTVTTRRCVSLIGGDDCWCRSIPSPNPSDGPGAAASSSPWSIASWPEAWRDFRM
jgi:2-polyprenyl-6-methoxyphenol hydroxylase-like FAD-dependent oxidoreductase